MESVAKTKVCKKCGVEWPASEYRVRVQHGRKYVCGDCRECRRAYGRIQSKRYTANNQEKIKANYLANKDRFRFNHLRRKYNLTPQALEDLLLSQSGLCAICQSSLSDLDRPYHIDHCHTTKQVRGVLCFSCNTGLGKFRDDPRLLESAFLYLTRYERPK